jgi:hypothetical protein
MSALNVYVGAFARVPGILETTHHAMRQCSAACGALPAAGAKFCAACGAAVSVTHKAVEQRVRLRSLHLADDVVDQLSCPEYCRGADELEAILIPNTRNVGLSVQNVGAVSLARVDQADEVNRFLERYGDVLHDLETTHGVTVTIDWGVVAWSY